MTFVPVHPQLLIAGICNSWQIQACWTLANTSTNQIWQILCASLWGKTFFPRWGPHADPSPHRGPQKLHFLHQRRGGSMLQKGGSFGAGSAWGRGGAGKGEMNKGRSKSDQKRFLSLADARTEALAPALRQHCVYLHSWPSLMRTEATSLGSGTAMVANRLLFLHGGVVHVYAPGMSCAGFPLDDLWELLCLLTSTTQKSLFRLHVCSFCHCLGFQCSYSLRLSLWLLFLFLALSVSLSLLCLCSNHDQRTRRQETTSTPNIENKSQQPEAQQKKYQQGKQPPRKEKGFGWGEVALTLPFSVSRNI